MKSIILIDDDPGMRDAFQFILDEDKYALTIFDNGYYILNSRFAAPDLFIIDKQLGSLDGRDVCLFLKKNDTTKNIPIILVTASTGLRQSAKEACADAWLEKPFSIDQVRDLVEKFI